jgi:CRISPR-associated endoribonuclease Cas6
MKQYKFKIDYDGKYSYSWGYALYSEFLKHIEEQTAKDIHEGMCFNQYISPEVWTVNIEDDINIELDFKDNYFLHKYNTNIRLLDKQVEIISEQELADKYLVNEPYKKVIRLFFETPTTFKQAGEYVLYPTIDLIMQSLTNKWNAFADRFVLEDLVWDNCKISRYNLRSALYHMKGVKIQGFVGYVDILFWGSESMIRLGNLVCNFAKYSGVGIKTRLGMGGTRVE